MNESSESLWDVMPCGLLVLAANGTIELANRTMAAWLLTTPEALVGRRFVDLLTTGSKLFHQTHWSPLLTMQGSVAEVQLELVRSPTENVPMLVNAVRRDDGRVHLALFVAADRRKYERELLLARRRAEELLERVAKAEADARERANFAEQLIGIVSHDLRNPLNAIVLGAQLVDTGDPGARAKVARRIASAANRATRLIADLLDFTQARLGGGLRVAHEELFLHNVVAECVEELKLAWPERAIIHRRVGGNTDAGSGDKDRLAQVITNLVGNAMAYGAPDTPVTVTSVVEGDRMEIVVHNQGPAIPEAVQARMFEPMERGTDAAGKKTPRSVGLGLYIVRQVAIAHGGAVTVRSRLDEGTTFRIELPRAAP